MESQLETDFVTTQHLPQGYMSKVVSERVTNLLREQSNFLDTHLQMVKNESHEPNSVEQTLKIDQTTAKRSSLKEQNKVLGIDLNKTELILKPG